MSIALSDSQRFDVDLAGAETLGDVVNRIKAATDNLLEVNIDWDEKPNQTEQHWRLKLTDRTATLLEVKGPAAGQLGLEPKDYDDDGIIKGEDIKSSFVITSQTKLVDLNVTVTGEDTPDLIITLRNGNTANVDLADATTIEDVIDSVEAAIDAVANRPGLYRVEINEAQTGLNLIVRVKRHFDIPADASSIRGQIHNFAPPPGSEPRTATQRAADLFNRTQSLPGFYREVFSGQGTIFTLDQIMGSNVIGDEELQPIDFLILEKPLRASVCSSATRYLKRWKG